MQSPRPELLLLVCPQSLDMCSVPHLGAGGRLVTKMGSLPSGGHTQGIQWEECKTAGAGTPPRSPDEGHLRSQGRRPIKAGVQDKQSVSQLPLLHKEVVRIKCLNTCKVLLPMPYS